MAEHQAQKPTPLVLKYWPIISFVILYGFAVIAGLLHIKFVQAAQTKEVAELKIDVKPIQMQMPVLTSSVNRIETKQEEMSREQQKLYKMMVRIDAKLGPESPDER